MTETEKTEAMNCAWLEFKRILGDADRDAWTERELMSCFRYAWSCGMKLAFQISVKLAQEE